MVKENSMDSVRISGAFYFTGQKWPKFCTAAVSLGPRGSDAPSAKSREKKRAHRDAHVGERSNFKKCRRRWAQLRPKAENEELVLRLRVFKRKQGP